LIRAPQRRLHMVEFTALLAFLTANVAFAIDAILPALPQIAAELTPDAANRAQLVLTSFVLGMGLGTFFTGPLSDALGRKRTILWGALLYILGAGLGAFSQDLGLLLAAHRDHGTGPRPVCGARNGAGDQLHHDDLHPGARRRPGAGAGDHHRGWLARSVRGIHVVFGVLAGLAAGAPT
jgi:hypothetical protein